MKRGRGASQTSPEEKAGRQKLAKVGRTVAGARKQYEILFDQVDEAGQRVENEAGAEPHRTVGRGVMRPKLLYANERTFIHWSHICSLVASTAMAVTSSPKARLLTGSNAVNWLWAGGLLSAVAISLLGYAHHIYFWRARAILQSSEKRCDDPLGPLMLSCTLLVAITAGALAILLPENQ